MPRFDGGRAGTVASSLHYLWNSCRLVDAWSPAFMHPYSPPCPQLSSPKERRKPGQMGLDGPSTFPSEAHILSAFQPDVEQRRVRGREGRREGAPWGEVWLGLQFLPAWDWAARRMPRHFCRWLCDGPADEAWVSPGRQPPPPSRTLESLGCVSHKQKFCGITLATLGLQAFNYWRDSYT